MRVKHLDQIEMAESSQNLTMTERSQNLSKIDAAKCNNLLTTQKKLTSDKMLRCKEMIKRFHLKEDCGLSITNISQEIDSTYRRI